MTVLVELLAPDVAALLDVPEEVYPLAVKYLRIYLAGTPVILLYNFEAAIFRSCGNTRTPLAAFSAAYNLEIFSYYIANSYGQTCTTFVGQNYGAGENDCCRRVLKLCLLQSVVGTMTSIGLILLSSHPLLGIFNRDPAVIAAAQIRLGYMFIAYLSAFMQEGLSGYLWGFGVSFIPAACAVVGICGVRLTWLVTVFRRSPSFATIMQVYPLRLGITAFVILAVTLLVKPSERYPDKGPVNS